MRDRLGGNRLVTERDAYDFAVARTKAPDDLAHAWQTMDSHAKASAIALYRETAAADLPRHGNANAQALADVRYPGLAADLWSQVARMLDSNLEYVPPLREANASG